MTDPARTILLLLVKGYDIELPRGFVPDFLCNANITRAVRKITKQPNNPSPVRLPLPRHHPAQGYNPITDPGCESGGDRIASWYCDTNNLCYDSDFCRRSFNDAIDNVCPPAGVICLAEQCLFRKDSGGAMVAWESGPVRQIVDVGHGCCRFTDANRVALWDGTVSKMSCATQCRANANCRAFEWHSKTRHCEHHDVSPSEGSAGVDGSAHCAGVKCYSKFCDIVA